jgi:hypothetical protein
MTNPVAKEIKVIILRDLEAVKQTALHTFATEQDDLIVTINKASEIMAALPEEQTT